MRKTILWTSLALLLLLPACSAAVTEGVVEDAPQVDVEVMQKASISYLPDGSYYAGYGDWMPAWENAQVWAESGFDGECYHDVEQRPRMTAGEALRAKKLLEAYQKGEIAYTGESILNRMDNVVVGVYALAPENYDGEQAYVILPGPCMTDEQILAVIDAYAQMGLTFDPDALSYRNCARGGGVETNRFFTEEESERYTTLARLIEKGLIDPAGNGAQRTMHIGLDSRYFCGLPDFTIRPYRSATDAEMVAQLAAMGIKDMSGVIDAQAVERRSRETLNAMGAPLSMALEYVFTEGAYVPCCFDAQGRQGHNYEQPSRSAYGAMFSWTTPEGHKTYAQTMIDWETNTLVSAHWANQRDWDANPGPSEMNVTGEAAMAAAKEAEVMLGLESPVWHLQEEVMHNDWGACRMVRTQVQEGLWLTVYVGGDDGRVHGVQIELGEMVDTLPEDHMPVNR